MNTWIAGKDVMKSYYPTKKRFLYNLNMEDTTDVDYRHVKKVFENLVIKIEVIVVVCMFRVIHYYLHMYFNILEINVLK